MMPRAPLPDFVASFPPLAKGGPRSFPPLAKGGSRIGHLRRRKENHGMLALFVVINCGPCAPFIGGCLASLRVADLPQLACIGDRRSVR